MTAFRSLRRSDLYKPALAVHSLSCSVLSLRALECLRHFLFVLVTFSPLCPPHAFCEPAKSDLDLK